MNLWEPTYTNNQHLFSEWLQQVFNSITHPYTPSWTILWRYMQVYLHLSFWTPLFVKLNKMYFYISYNNRLYSPLCVKFEKYCLINFYKYECWMSLNHVITCQYLNLEDAVLIKLFITNNFVFDYRQTRSNSDVW